MNERYLMEADSSPERQLRNVPSVDSAMVVTPSQSTEHLLDPEVVKKNPPENSPRPRTRLERLTEKHTSQRPNWAMASLDESPTRMHLPTAAKEARQLRRMPNTNLRAGPPWEQKNLPRTDIPIKKNTPQAAPARTTTAPNWALAEEQTLQQEDPWVPKQDGKRSNPTDPRPLNIRRDYVHPSRAAQICDTHQPVTAPEPPLIRGPVDAGWGQRRVHQTAKSTTFPVHTHQMRYEVGPRHGYVESNYRERDESKHWPSKQPNDLRKVASSPNNYGQAISFINATAYQRSQIPHNRETSYETQVNHRADANVKQLEFDFSSISLEKNGNNILEMDIPDSRDMNTHFLGKPRGQYPPSPDVVQNNVRPMHSAPDLMQRPPSNQNPAFLHVHRPTPIRATEYIGAFSGFPAVASQPVTLEELVEYQEANNAPTGPRGLRRIPRFSEMPAGELMHMQHRAMYDRMQGMEPTYNRTEHASQMGAYVQQQQQHLAKERSTADSSPEFVYNGIDSFEKPQLPPQQTDHPTSCAI